MHIPAVMYNAGTLVVQFLKKRELSTPLASKGAWH